MADEWQTLQGALAEVVCETDLMRTHRVQGRFISNQELITEIAMMSWRTGLATVQPFTFNFRCLDGNSYAAQDGLEVTPANEVGRVYEFKSTAYTNIDRDQSDNLLNPLLHRKSREVLTLALTSILATDPKDLRIPLPEQIELVKVVAQERIGEEPRKRNKKVKREFNDTIIVGLPNIRNLTYFVLKLLIGEIPHQRNWENYFTPLTPAAAQTLVLLHSIGKGAYL